MNHSHRGSVHQGRGSAPCWIVDGCRSPQRTTYVEVPALAVYTSGQTREKGPQNYHFYHFSARPARLPGANARSASRSVRNISDLSGCSWALKIPRGYRCTEAATPISAPCSLFRVAHIRTRPERVRRQPWVDGQESAVGGHGASRSSKIKRRITIRSRMRIMPYASSYS
jgi:hypothetical protein